MAFVSVGCGVLANLFKQEGHKANDVAFVGCLLMAAGALIDGILTIRFNSHGEGAAEHYKIVNFTEAAIQFCTICFISFYPDGFSKFEARDYSFIFLNLLLTYDRFTIFFIDYFYGEENYKCLFFNSLCSVMVAVGILVVFFGNDDATKAGDAFENFVMLFLVILNIVEDCTSAYISKKTYGAYEDDCTC